MVFYGSKIFHIKTRCQSFQLDHYTVATIIVIHSAVSGFSSVANHYIQGGLFTTNKLNINKTKLNKSVTKKNTELQNTLVFHMNSMLLAFASKTSATVNACIKFITQEQCQIPTCLLVCNL